MAWLRISSKLTATFGVSSVVALLMTPLMFERRSATLRERISGVSEPARDDAASLRLSLALEVAAVRGYLISQDKAMLVDFASARAVEKQAFDHLFSRTPALGNDVHAAALAAQAASTSWNEANEALVSGKLPVPAFIARLADQQARYRAALGAGGGVERAIGAFAAAQRQLIQQSQTVGVIVLAALTLLATASAAMTIRSATELSRQTELARTDALTGLLNRRAFEEATGSELERAVRHRYAVTVVYVDVDHFKTVNDERGHAVGDRLLRDIGSSIRKAIRRIDVAARLGGDEFAILLSESAETVSDDAVRRVRDVVFDELNARRWAVSLSMGAVTAPPGHGDVSMLLHAADEMMYAVKRESKGSLRWKRLVPANG